MYYFVSHFFTVSSICNNGELNTRSMLVRDTSILKQMIISIYISLRNIHNYSHVLNMRNISYRMSQCELTRWQLDVTLMYLRGSTSQEN
jgi:hypothetical protein